MSIHDTNGSVLLGTTRTDKLSGSTEVPTLVGGGCCSGKMIAGCLSIQLAVS